MTSPLDCWMIGLACLIFVAVRRPPLYEAPRLAARRNAQVAERIRRERQGS